MIKTFIKSVENVLKNKEPLENQLYQLRCLLKKNLLHDDFRLNCVEKLISSMEGFSFLTNSWSLPNIFYHNDLKFSIRIIIWSSFYENNPHQHKTWSVTGILHNSLNINTYTWLENRCSLKKDRVIIAKAGEVGSLLPGCIHNINNHTHELSASFHIFNNIDVSDPEKNAIWYPAPRKHNLSQGLMERALMICLLMTFSTKSQKFLSLIHRIFEVSPISVKLMAIQLLLLNHRDIAVKYFESL